MNKKYNIRFGKLAAKPAYLLLISLLAATGQHSLVLAARPDRGRPLQDSIVVFGRVINQATQLPIVGAHISAPGVSVLSNEHGVFEAKLLVNDNLVSVSAEGFHTKELPFVPGDSLLVYLLDRSRNSLFQEVVLPFDSKSNVSLGSATQALQGDDKWPLQQETPDTYLQGRISGLQAVRRSGTPGIGASLYLRGYNSLYATNQPLVVVDGVPYETQSYGNSLIGGHLNNPLQHIDVKDIDQISVVKDALTTYGSKGANGLILITTSRARQLATQIDFATYGSVGFVPAKLPLLGADDHRIYLADYYKRQGHTAEWINSRPYFNAEEGTSDYYRYGNSTDWQEEVFRPAIGQQYFLKVSGGDNIARYALSLGYLNQEGITDETGLKRYQTRFNADLNLTQKLTGRANLAFSYNDQRLKDQGLSPLSNPIYLALTKSPFIATHELNSSGVASPNLSDVDIFGVGNPLAIIGNAIETDQNYRFSGIFGLNYQFNDRWGLSTLASITYDKVRENIFIPDYGVASDTLDLAVINNRSGSRVQRYNALFNETRLHYRQSFGQVHDLQVNIGFRYQSSRAEEDYARDYNSATDDLISVGNGLVNLRAVGGEIGESHWLNNFVAVDYNWASRYFLQAVLNVDASSRFGKQIADALTFNGVKYATLPAIGAAWRLSSEKFLRDVHQLDLLKLKASYGVVGNDDIGNYSARNYYVSQNLLGMQGLIRGNIGTPGLQWESVRKFNIGLDAAFFHERLTISADYFRHSTHKALAYQQLTDIAGIEQVIANTAALSNRGFELQVQGRILNGRLTWDAGFNISKTINRVDRLPDGAAIETTYAGATYITQVGSAANLFYGYRTNGIYQTADEAMAEGLVVQRPNGTELAFGAGDVRFVDINGDNVINETDRQVIGNPNPDYFGGITQVLALGRWQLNGLFTFSYGNDAYNYTRSVLERGNGTGNQTTYQLDRWLVDGQQTAAPAVGGDTDLDNGRFSDRWVEDASYLRLRSLSLGYRFPLGKNALRHFHVYLTANNLFTLSRYKGYDPEFSSSDNIFTRGADVTLEPLNRSVQLGLRIGL